LLNWALMQKDAINISPQDVRVSQIVDENITLFTTIGTIEVSAKEVEGLVQLLVKDDGTGFHKDVLDNLHKGAHINSTTGTASEAGSGIGLQLVKHLVVKNNGYIKISNDSDRGAIIQINIPTAS